MVPPFSFLVSFVHLFCEVLINEESFVIQDDDELVVSITV